MIDIDDRYAGRLAFMLECLIVDYHGYWDAACALLDEYKAEWENVNPSPPTFMGEPAAPQAEPTRDPNPDEVICPACTHQFRAIPENVQAQLWALDDVQIEARDALLDFISENGTASEGVQHYLDRYVRAALAQIEQEKANGSR